MIFELSGIVSNNSVTLDLVQIKKGSRINKIGSGENESYIQSMSSYNSGLV